MKRRIFYLMALTVLLPAAISSCARTPEENVKELHEKVLAAHVKIVHLDTLQKTESGLYYTILQQGLGKKNTDSAMVFIRETIRDLQGIGRNAACYAGRRN